MKTKSSKHFKDDIQKTFTIYALIPVIIITFLSYLISVSMWYRTVVNQNHRINAEVSQRIESIISSYINEANRIAEEDSIVEFMASRENSIAIYEEYYY